MSYYMGGEGRRLFGQTTPSELRDKFQMSVRMPIGVIGVITPWNFPIAIPSWKIAPALVAGNTVVFKPATDTPRSGSASSSCSTRPASRAGVVNIVHGGGGAVGDRLVRHPDVRSSRSRARARPASRSSERGRRAQARPPRARRQERDHRHGRRGPRARGRRDRLVGVRHLRASAARRRAAVIVHESLYDELEPRLVERAEALRLGPGWEDETDVGPVINGAALEKIHSYTQIGVDEGAKLLTGGEIASDGDLAKGFYYRPTIFGDVEPEMRIAQEEIFGPTLSLISVRDEDRRRSASRTGSATGSRPRSSPATSTAPSARCATSRPGSRTSTRARSAPRCTSRSAASRRPATATARPARPRSTSSPSGSRSTSTTRGRCSARRSTMP